MALGLGGAFFASRLLTRFLFYVSPKDPVTFVTVSVVLLAVAVVAGVVPVRRAIRTDPVVILRAE